MDNYSSVLVADASVPRRSRWMLAANTSSDQLTIAIAAPLAGTVTIEGTSDTSVVVAELARNPQYSDDSAASFSNVTSDCSFNASLTVAAVSSGTRSVSGTYVGSSTYIRVRWVPTAGSGPIVVTTSGAVTSSAATDLVEPALGDLGYDVRRFTPNGDELTADNFQDAIEAAIQAAFVNVSKVVNLEVGAHPCVVVPPGIWPLRRQLRFAGLGFTSPRPTMPGLCGAGMWRTVMYVESGFEDTYQDVIYVGAEVDDAGLYAVSWTMSDLSLVGLGNTHPDLNGLHMQTTFHPIVSNVSIMGYISNNPELGIGIKTSVGQHVQFSNVWVQACTTGMFLDQLTPCILRDVHLNQNLVRDIVYDRCTLDWIGGTMQGGGTIAGPGRLPRGNSRAVTGWSVEVATGTGAAVATAVGSQTTVTGLSGMDAATHLHCWLYLEAASPFTDTDLVSGYYLIEEIVSATSVKIRKGSTHSSATSLVWGVYRSGSTRASIRSVYHEGTCAALVTTVQATNGAAHISLTHSDTANAEAAVESLGTHGLSGASVEVFGNVGATYQVRAKFAKNIVALDAVPATLDCDNYSRESLVARSVAPDGVVAGLYQPGGPALGGRLRTLTEQYGAVLRVDARDSANYVLSGANVQQLNSVVNGNTINSALAHAAVYPQYVASDSGSNTPAINFPAAVSTNNAAFTWTIPAARFATQFEPCIMVVGRIASAASAGDYRRVALVNAGSPSCITTIDFNEAGAGFVVEHVVAGSSDGRQLKAADTLPHALIAGGCGRTFTRGNSETTTTLAPNLNAYKFWQNNGDVTFGINIQPGADGNILALIVYYAAVFPFGLPQNARAALLDAAASEFAVAGR